MIIPAAMKAWSEGRNIFIKLTDKRTIGFPDEKFKLLKNASAEQLEEVEI